MDEFVKVDKFVYINYTRVDRRQGNSPQTVENEMCRCDDGPRFDRIKSQGTLLTVPNWLSESFILPELAF